ncbi:MAG: hypothetical protein ACPG6P_00735 [Akkermansiaceae bacterium]
MLFFTIGAWLAGVCVSFVLHNRKLPLTIFTLGVLTLVAQYTVGLGYITIVILALLAAIIWIGNKFDMS